MVEENPGGAEKNDGPAGRKSFIPIYPDTLPTVPKPPKSSRTASLERSRAEQLHGVFSVAENAAEQADRLGEGEVGRFGIEAGAFIASEGVLGGIEESFVADSGALQGAVNGFASCAGHVRVVGPEDHQKFTADFPCASQRSGIGVLTEFAIMDAGAVVTHGSPDIGLECGTKGQMAADAKTNGADFPWRDEGMLGKPVQTSAAVGIEMRDRRRCGVLLAAVASSVVEGDDRARRFDAAINFRGSNDKPVTRQANASAQQWRRKLKNV